MSAVWIVRGAKATEEEANGQLSICQHGYPADTCDTLCKCGHECRYHYNVKFRKYSNVGACDKCQICYEFEYRPANWSKYNE